jgi:hypothetical protein
MNAAPRLSEIDLACALLSWWQGADTLDIAEFLRTTEAAVANSLARHRELHRLAQAA